MEAINILVAVLLLLSALAGAWLTRINQRQAATIADRDAQIVELQAERKALATANLDTWHAAWVACEEHMRATPLVAQAHDAAMVELLGVVSDHDAARQSGELSQAGKEPVSA